MMDPFCENLNDLLVHAFRSVLKIEEEMLRAMGPLSLSISEMHLLEAVRKRGDQGCTVSEAAKELSLSLPSITVAVNKLEKKGLLERAKAADDGRSVILTLTAQGQKMERIHQHFHENMVNAIARDMDDTEKEALLKGMGKLNCYFDQRLSTKG